MHPGEKSVVVTVCKQQKLMLVPPLLPLLLPLPDCQYGPVAGSAIIKAGVYIDNTEKKKEKVEAKYQPASGLCLGIEHLSSTRQGRNLGT